MRSTFHFDERQAQRGFNERAVSLILEHGDYVEQKGQSYVLDFSDKQKVHDVQAALAGEQQELMFRLKKLGRARKAAIKENRQAHVDSLDEQIAATKEVMKDLKKEKKSVRPGFVVIGAPKQEAGAAAVTVCKRFTHQQIRGYRTIKES